MPTGFRESTTSIRPPGSTSSFRPQVGFSRVRNERAVRTSWSVGWTAAAGVEWFATRDLSLSASYGLTLSYVRIRQTWKFASATQNDFTHEYLLQPSSVVTALSVYF